MKRSVRTIRNSLGFLFGLIAIAFVAAAALDAVARRDISSKANWTFAFRDQHLSFVVLGSSRGLLTVNVPTLERAIGGRGLNLSVAGASFPELALILDRFLEANESHVLLLEVDSYGLDSASFTYPFHAYSYLPYIDESTVESHLQAYFGSRALLWRYVPMFKYAEFNDQIGFKSLTRILRREGMGFDSTGSRLTPGIMAESTIRNIRSTSYSISDARVSGLNAILDIAARHNVAVILFVAPQFTASAEADKSRARVFSFYRGIAASRGLPFLVFDGLDIDSDPANFRDVEHLNRDGAVKFSVLLGERIRPALKP